MSQAQPFTPEQESRLREIIGEELSNGSLPYLAAIRENSDVIVRLMRRFEGDAVTVSGDNGLPIVITPRGAEFFEGFLSEVLKAPAPKLELPTAAPLPNRWWRWFGQVSEAIVQSALRRRHAPGGQR